jgi:hypothetical protein
MDSRRDIVREGRVLTVSSELQLSVTARRIRVALWTVIALVGLARIIAIFTQNVARDEFLFRYRAVASIRSGDVIGHGRPGLGTLVLMPLPRSVETR